MEKFKVTRKHLTGEVAGFPRRVVQAMVDEQVRQGNPADPSVFAKVRTACKHNGGFTWIDSALGNSWADILWGKKFHLIPKRGKRAAQIAPRTEATPHEIIQHMLDKGMAVWVCASDKSYDDARADIGHYAYRVTEFDTDSHHHPVWTQNVVWRYAVPIDIATMTEITGVPK